jgi:uncharacterized delta-60 repeat protein
MNVDGSPDTTFGIGGAVVTSVSPWDEFGGMALQADGKVVLVGTAQFGVPYTSNYKPGIEIVRYNSNGTLDTTFGRTGETINYMDGQSLQGLAVAVQPDGKIVAAGTIEPPGFSTLRPVLLRVTADGALDSPFGVGGHVIDSSGQPFDSFFEANSVSVLPNGDLVIGGSGVIAWFDSRGDLINTRTDVPGTVSTFGTWDFCYAVSVPRNLRHRVWLGRRGRLGWAGRAEWFSKCGASA